MRGIYSITNTITNEVLYGQSKDIEHRLKVHKTSLKGNYHCNPLLQNSWNKYGETVFTFEPFYITEEPNLTYFEKKAITESKLPVFNIADPENPTKLSPESIRRMVKSRNKNRIGRQTDTVSRYLNEATQKMSLYW